MDRYPFVIGLGAIILLVAVAARPVIHTSTMCNMIKDHIIRILYRQCGRWAMAAEQDHSEVVRLLHANYATGYLWAIRDIASDKDFARATGGEDLMAFEGRIVRTQDAAARALVATCPNLAKEVEPRFLRAAYTYPDPFPTTAI